MAMTTKWMAVVAMCAALVACGDSGGDVEPTQDAGVDTDLGDAGDALSGDASADVEPDSGDTGQAQEWPPSHSDCLNGEYRHSFLDSVAENETVTEVPFYHKTADSGSDAWQYIRRVDVSVDRSRVESISFDFGGDARFRVGPSLYNRASFEFSEEGGALEDVDDHNAIDFDFSNGTPASAFPSASMSISIKLEDGRGTLGDVEVNAIYECWSR